MNIALYSLQTIDPEHRNVRINMRGYLAGYPSVVRSLRGGIVPSYTTPFSATVEDVDAGEIPTYATFVYNGIEYGAFVKSVEPVTPNAIRLWLRADWWYMFMDSDITTTTQRARVMMNGTLVRSTIARNPDYGFPAHYATPADMSDLYTAATYSPIWVDSYRLVATFQCYKNNTFPVKDGNAFQVTVITTNTYTADQVRAQEGAPFSFMNMATFATIGANPEQYTIISISRFQIVPAALIPTTAGYGTQGAAIIGTESVAVSALICFAATIAHTPAVDSRIPWSAIGTNNARNRLFIGNGSVMIPLPDVLSTATQYPIAVRSMVTATDGFVCTLYSDQTTDISRLFDMPISYNSDSEMAYQAGDSRMLSAISSGVSGTVQAVAGAGMLASGNPLGFASLASAGITVAGAVKSSEYRGRQVVVSGNNAGVGMLDNRIVCGVQIQAANSAARHLDAVLRGYECQIGIAGNTIPEIFKAMPADTGFSYSLYEYFRFADDLIVRPFAVRDSAGELLAPLPPSDVVEEIRAAFVRGVAVWGAGTVGDTGTLNGRRVNV